MPRAFLDDLEVITVGGTTMVDKILGFFANTVFVENYTSQWVFVAGISFVPPYTSRLIRVGGIQRARVQFAAPPGIVQVASIAGQICNSTWSERDVPQLGGAVGPIGVVANYYDRNPKSFVFQFSLQSVGPSGVTVRGTYTVPANRKAFIETSQTIAILQGAGDLALGSTQTGLQLTPSGGATTTIFVAYIQGLAPVRTYAASLIGSSIELLPGDKIEGFTLNLYTATLSTHIGLIKGTEFDA